MGRQNWLTCADCMRADASPTRIISPAPSLRSQSLDMVEQELWGYLLTHYAIRALTDLHGRGRLHRDLQRPLVGVVGAGGLVPGSASLYMPR